MFYTFSIRENVHDIELIYNSIVETIEGVESGMVSMSVAKYNRLCNFLENKIKPIYEVMHSRGCSVVLLDSNQLKIAKEIAVWAREKRSLTLNPSKEYKYLKSIVHLLK